MKKCKALAFALIFVLALYSLAACGNTPAPVENAPAAPEAAETETQTDAEASSAPEQPAGEPLTFHNVLSGTITAASPTGASNPERLQAVHDYILEQTNIDIKYTILPNDGAAATERLNMMLAAGEEADCYEGNWLNRGSVLELAKLGMLEPLNDLLDNYGPNVKSLWARVASQETSDQLWGSMTDESGIIWGIPISPPMAGNTVYVRQDWLDLYDLPVPATIAELEEAFRVIKENDPAGNGETVPLLLEPGNNGHEALAGGFMDTGIFRYFADSDGQVKPIAFNPDFREYIGKLAEWYSLGYIYSEYAGMADGNRQIEVLKGGNIFAYAGWHSRVTNSVEDLRNAHGGEWTIIENLQGPKGNSRTMGSLSTNGWVLNKGTPNGEAIIRYLDWCYGSLDNTMTIKYGIKGMDWTEGLPGELKETTNEYVGEFTAANNYAMTMQMDSSAPNTAPAYWYYKNIITSAEKSKPKALQAEDPLMNWTAINESTPTADIDRIFGEWTSQFIMNTKPMSEYDAFLEEMGKAGVDRVIEAVTAEYNAVRQK